MSQCKCTSVALNTGTPAKQQVLNAAEKLIFVRMKDGDGNNNGVNITEDTSQTWLESLTRNADETKRWFPIGPLTAVENVRADPTYETFADNSRAITSKGLKTFTGMLVGFAPAYMKVLNSVAGCSEIGFYTVDRCGGLSGAISKDGDVLYPIRIARSSFDTQYVQGTAAAAAKIQVRFDVDMIENDENIRTLTGAEADFLGAEGLLQVEPTKAADVSTTKFTTSLNLYSGAFKGEVTQWVAGDFELKEGSTSVTISGVNEVAPGRYEFTFDSQSTGDKLELTKKATEKTAFALTPLIINIP